MVLWRDPGAQRHIVVAAAKAIGRERFALAGHDRGALIAIRVGLDHPDAVTHLLSLDVLPTLDMWAILKGADAKGAWHVHHMAQPAGVTEPMIQATEDNFFTSFLEGWAANRAASPPPTGRRTREKAVTGDLSEGCWVGMAPVGCHADLAGRQEGCAADFRGKRRLRSSMST